MASSFGWLDTDGEQQRRMLEVVDLFATEGTVDEIGIGTVRDAIADILFPGTSTLHTRLRYVLFIPWLMHEAARRKPTADEMRTEFHNLEIRLIGGLVEGGERDGVIGRDARKNLKRMPSDMYWAALRTWGIRTDDTSRTDYFRKRQDLRALQRRTEQSDDPGAREVFQLASLDPHLPAPPQHPDAPGPWFSSVTFALTAYEEDYLAQRLIENVPDSLLTWLVRQPAAELPDTPWELDLGGAPTALRATVDHARRFQAIIHGASLLYNLLLARKSERDDLVDRYEARLVDWRADPELDWALDTWREHEFWNVITRQNPRIRLQTRAFVTNWVRFADAGTDPRHDTTAIELVTRRERSIKGPRARLFNQAALDAWGGSSAAGRLQFRWPQAKSHLGDLYAARPTTAAASETASAA